MGSPALDWSSADVRDNTLTVQISGERSSDWDASLSLALTLLAADTPWSGAAADDGTMTVPNVRAGDEDQLRFMLEGAMQQADADQTVGTEPDADDDEGGSGGSDDERGDAEQQMTDRLRGFANADDDDGAEGAGDEQ